MKSKIEHDYLCSGGKPAKYNGQGCYNVYKISNKGNFKLIDSACIGDNDFFCDKCAEKEGLI